MNNNLKNIGQISSSHFTRAAFGEVERSRMNSDPIRLTTFNGGDIVPVYCKEILPSQHIDTMNIDFDIRSTTMLAPNMSTMFCDIFAFFVPNRIVNRSWKEVQGENSNGAWAVQNIELAPLVSASDTRSTISVPVQSVADYYDFPTFVPINSSILKSCHDLKFRGYVMIYNEYFRDQNYEAPIPFTALNIYQNFFPATPGESVNIVGTGSSSVSYTASEPADGSYGAGAVAKEFGNIARSSNLTIPALRYSTNGSIQNAGFNALGKPLKANKLHDYFTSCLPSPQKSIGEVMIPVSGSISSVPVVTGSEHDIGFPLPPLRFLGSTNLGIGSEMPLVAFNDSSDVSIDYVAGTGAPSPGSGSSNSVYPTNLWTKAASVSGLDISINDLRMAAATQQYYEILARGGSRYSSIVQSLFGIEVANPFSDIPQFLGRVRKELDIFQTAQTSATQDDSTPQGNLTAFGYTVYRDGPLFKNWTAVEHGYLHIFAVVRHRNLYSGGISRDNFRRTALDFYQPTFANLSEQPVKSCEINCGSSFDSVFGYQEAWAEYREEPDLVSGYMRPGITESLSLWNYADNPDADIVVKTPNWLKSNTEEVLNRCLAITSAKAPQFKASFKFYIDKALPMPVKSVPGMDII